MSNEKCFACNAEKNIPEDGIKTLCDRHSSEWGEYLSELRDNINR